MIDAHCLLSKNMLLHGTKEARAVRYCKYELMMQEHQVLECCFSSTEDDLTEVHLPHHQSSVLVLCPSSADKSVTTALDADSLTLLSPVRRVSARMSTCQIQIDVRLQKVATVIN